MHARGAKLWDPIPTPTLEVPFVEVDQAVLLELWRRAEEAQPGTGPCSPQDPDLAHNLWYRTFDIGR